MHESVSKPSNTVMRSMKFRTIFVRGHWLSETISIEYEMSITHSGRPQESHQRVRDTDASSVGSEKMQDGRADLPLNSCTGSSSGESLLDRCSPEPETRRYGFTKIVESVWHRRKGLWATVARLELLDLPQIPTESVADDRHRNNPGNKQELIELVP